MLKDRNIILFSSDDWDSGLKTSKYHVAVRLARENRVLFVNSIGFRTPNATSGDIQRVLHKIRMFFRGYQTVNHNLFVYTPLILPFYNSVIVRYINHWILVLSIKFVKSMLHLSNPMLWIFTPNMVNMIGHLNEAEIIYYCVDNQSAHKDVNSKMLDEMEHKLLKKADIVIACSKELSKTREKINPNTYYIPHGVDWDLFRKALDENLQIADDIAPIRKPIIGFYGFVSYDWVDFDLLKKIAMKHTEWSIVLIGKSSVDLRELIMLGNIYYLGVKKFEDLPMYSKAFDVAIIPFNINELTLNSNPLKLLEYLASGKPVVSTRIPEVTKYGNMVKIADTSEEFISAIEQCLKENSTAEMYKRSDSVKTESWDGRMEIISQKLSEYMSNSKNKKDEPGES